MMAPNVGLSPTVVHSILDAFFEVKKCEMKQQVALELDQMRHQMGLEMDRAVENMFGGLVAQVKQLLIPMQQQEEEDAAASTTSVIVPNGDGGHKSESTTTSPESKIKSVPRSSDQDQSPNSSVKRCTNDSIAPSNDSKNRAVVRSSTEPELQKQQQITKNSSIKVEPSDSSVEFPKRTTHYAIKSVPRPTDSLPEGGNLVVKSCVDTNTVKREESGDPEDGTNRPVKRQRTESSKDHQADRPETAATPSSKFPCGICGKSFTRRDHLKRHSRIHQGAKPYHCKWPDCSYFSADNSHILRHIRGLHFKQSGKKGAAQDDGDGDPRDPKEFVRVDKDLLN